MQENRLLEEQCSQDAQCSQEPKFAMLHFLAFYALLSFWSLIYNAELDSNSSCLDRLNNFCTISLQKLQNFLQNAISRIIGTLMCKLG